MPKRQTALNYLGKVNRNNQPVAVMSNIENHKAIDFIGVGKALP